MNNSCILVAIAKNENKYIKEWVNYHLNIGFDRILIYDNESSDGMSETIDSIVSILPVERISWPSFDRISPQRSAYNNAVLNYQEFKWALFIDIDEFFVPWDYKDVHDFISNIPSFAGAVAINWQTFGSSGVLSDNYNSVLQTFTHCGGVDWTHNRHFKTLARLDSIKEMKIHDVELSNGIKLSSDFQPLKLISEGRSEEVIHDGVQINHYQCKTYIEFQKRMSRGNANFPPGHPNHVRDSSLEKFKKLDRNDVIDQRISKFIK